MGSLYLVINVVLKFWKDLVQREGIPLSHKRSSLQCLSLRDDLVEREGQDPFTS